jgi:hypothetical protein
VTVLPRQVRPERKLQELGESMQDVAFASPAVIHASTPLHDNASSLSRQADAMTTARSHFLFDFSLVRTKVSDQIQHIASVQHQVSERRTKKTKRNIKTMFDSSSSFANAAFDQVGVTLSNRRAYRERSACARARLMSISAVHFGQRTRADVSCGR